MNSGGGEGGGGVGGGGGGKHTKNTLLLHCDPSMLAYKHGNVD